MRPRGRPPKFGKTMRQTAIWLPENQIAWLKKRDNASETIRKMLEEKMEPIMELTDEQKRDYAETCADAYVCQYIEEGSPVMGEPIIVFSRISGFSWKSSLTPLSDEEVIADEAITDGCYGDPGDDPDAAREAIANFIMEEYGPAEWSNIEDKINAE